MDVVRSIRIHLPDRPGSLSSISTALAVHEVNIARLHVVSHEGPTVIDDLDLTATSAQAIDRAIAGFYPDVRVECFDTTLGDPVVSVARGLAAMASAANGESAMQALVGWALSVVRADVGALLHVTDGAITQLAGAHLAAFSPREVSAFRSVAENGAPVTLAMGETSSALPFTGLQVVRAAVSRVNPAKVLAVARRSPIPFASGELERLASFSEAAGAVLALK
jgi:hypothetical protein